MKQSITVTINGKKHTHDVEPRLLLIHFLREVVGLTGPHIGCETSLCGACTVQVNGKAMAAGEYTIVQPTSPADTIIVRSVQKPSPALAIFRRTASTEVATKSQLVFRRYGNQYFMANMQVQGVAGNLELLTTKAERNLVKELSGRFLANNKVEPELVTVALTQ